MSESSLPPAGLTWSEYVERWVDDCGGWLPLADQLIHRAGDRVEVPSDPQTVERGLRPRARMSKTIRSARPPTIARRIDLRVPVFGQREAECGNTSLKSVLWFLGQRISARQLGDLAGVTDDGVDHAPLVAAARRAGAAVFERSGGTIGELRWFLARRLPPIIGWWSQDAGDAAFDERWSLDERRARDCGHYSVVSGIDDRRVLLMDPQWRTRGSRRGVVGRRWLAIEELDRAWYDTDTPAYLHVERWYMVVHTGDTPFAPVLGAGVDHPPLPPVSTGCPACKSPSRRCIVDGCGF